MFKKIVLSVLILFLSYISVASKYAEKDQRIYVSKEEKAKYNALGSIRAIQSDNSTQFIGSAGIIQVEREETTRTLIVTSAHVANSTKFQGAKVFCIGDDPSNDQRSDCYFIDFENSALSSSAISPISGYDWAVLVLKKKVDKVITLGKRQSVKPFLVENKEGSSHVKSLIGMKVTNIAYSGDTERLRIKQKKKTKALPTVATCSFREKSGHSIWNTETNVAIHDCHAEPGSSGSAFVKTGSDQNYIYAINDGNWGAFFEDKSVDQYGNSFDPDRHYGKAVKIQGFFHKAILSLSEQFSIENSSNKSFVTKNIVVEVQKQLKRFGYKIGASDGVIGEKTEKAIRSYRLLKGLPKDDEINAELLGSMEIEVG